jgi:hypothetical protein
VLKPWTSQENLLNAASSRIRAPRVERKDHGAEILGCDAGLGAGLPGSRRVREVFKVKGTSPL